MILKNFFVFEGIDGTGTTTQLNNLKKRFSESGNNKIRFTCEPTDGETGKFIRRILSGEVSVTADTLAFLFAADRNEHISGETGILHMLAEGNAVFTDRYLFSSLVYQGEAGNPELPAKLNGGFPLPECLFFFDINPETAMERVSARAAEKNTCTEIFEKLEFQKRIHEKYKTILEEFKIREPEMDIITVDASLPPEEITEKIWTVVKNLPKIR